jgi:hypothetical protein
MPIGFGWYLLGCLSIKLIKVAAFVSQLLYDELGYRSDKYSQMSGHFLERQPFCAAGGSPQLL